MPKFGFAVTPLLTGVSVVTFLSDIPHYTEHTVTLLVSQMLQALGYLQWKGVCHLDIQPDNLVMSTYRPPSVKLIDFGSAVKAPSGGVSVEEVGHPEYTAPEVLFDGTAFPNTDIWSLGVVAYTLIAGVTPFRAETDDELKENIAFVRYRFDRLAST